MKKNKGIVRCSKISIFQEWCNIMILCFKLRCHVHTKSFRHKPYYVWDLKRKHIAYTLSWEILKYSNTVKPDSGQCNLCIEEKYKSSCPEKVMPASQSIDVMNLF